MRVCIPSQLRPSAMLKASLLSSPRTVRLLLLLSRGGRPSSLGSTACFGHFVGLLGVPTSNIAFNKVTLTPALNAWPAGGSGWFGEPPGGCWGRKKRLDSSFGLPRLLFSCWLRVLMSGSTAELSRSECSEGFRLNRPFLTPSTRLPMASGRSFRCTYHF